MRVSHKGHRRTDGRFPENKGACRASMSQACNLRGRVDEAVRVGCESGMHSDKGPGWLE